MSVLIPFSPKYYKKFISKNNTSVWDQTWDLSTFWRASVLSISITETYDDIYRNNR